MCRRMSLPVFPSCPGYSAPDITHTCIGTTFQADSACPQFRLFFTHERRRPFPSPYRQCRADTCRLSIVSGRRPPSSAFPHSRIRTIRNIASLPSRRNTSRRATSNKRPVRRKTPPFPTTAGTPSVSSAARPERRQSLGSSPQKIFPACAFRYKRILCYKFS